MRIFLFTLSLILASKMSFSQGTNCSSAEPFCTGTTYTFQNNVNVSSVGGPDYGCLLTQPNQAWYYMKIGTGGSIDIGINQTTGPNGTGSAIDVDFICWGPFSSPTGGCGSLTAGNTVDCSYSSSSTETCTIPSGVTGQYYVLLLTNYSNTSGYISFSQVSGAGSTDCTILCPAMGIGTVSAVSCTSSAVTILADQSPLPVGQVITPCLMFQVPLTDNSGKNILEVYENGTLLGCFRPPASASSCSPNAGVVPNGNKWEVYASFLNPSLSHSFRFCEDNSASTSGNMSYKIFDCQKTSGAPIASGTWVVNTGTAYPASCQSVTVNPGTGAGQWNFTGSSFFTGPGITTANWGGASFNPATAGPGTHTITYNWNNGVTGSGLCAGTKTMAITVSNPFNAGFTAPGPYCASASCATLTPTNTYTVGTNSWSGTGISGNTFCPGTSGVGSFPVTYSVGTSATCRASVTQTVTVNSNPTANAGSPAVITCTNSSAVLSGSGGTTYSWTGPAGGISSGGATATPTVTLPGTYTLLVANGTCTNSATVAVTSSTATPAVTSTVNAALNCTLTSVNANITTTATPVTYNWSGPGIIAGNGTGTISVNQGGTYNYTVTSNGCNTIGSQSVSQNTLAPVVTSAASAVLNCTLSSVNASASTTTTPVSYNWSGTGITAGAGTGTVTVNQPNTYNYTVTAANGCSVTGSQAVTQNTATPVVTSTTSAILNCTLTSVNASASTTTTPVSYNWSGTGITAGAGTPTITVNQPNTYDYTVTAANGCSVTGSQAVTQNTVTPVVTSTTSAPLNCTLTSVNASASTTTTPVSYNWSGAGITAGAGTGTITVNQPNTYNYTVTAANGCSVTGSQPVTQNTVTPVVTSATSSALNCTLTSVNASASTTTTPVSYNWSGAGITAGAGTATISVNQGGLFNYTVTAANGCSVTGSQSVAQNTITPSVTVAASGVLNCSFSSVDASATTTTSPVSYNWSGPNITSGAGTGTISVDQPGTYNYTVTNTTTGCFTTGSQAVAQNTTVPTVNAGTTQTLVCGVASVTLTGSGSAGSNPSWLGGVCGSATNFTTTACAPGTYTLIATDAVSTCTNSSIVSVSSSTNVPQATVNAVTNSITCTNSVVAIGVTYSGPDPVTYVWSGPGITGSTTSSVTTANQSGTYSVTITNTVSNCQSIYSAFVPTNTTPVIANVAPTASLTCVVNTVNLTATPTGTNYAYNWTGPGTITNGTTDSPTVDANGNYVVTITDNINGCTGSFTATVGLDNVAPTLSLAATSLSTSCSSTTVTLNASSNADPNSTYSWTTTAGGSLSNSNVNNPIALSGGGYNVAVTNTVNGCISAPQTVSVTADANIPTFGLSSTSVSLTCLSSSETVTLTTSSSDLTYTWSPTPSSGINTSTPTFDSPGIYSCVITNTVNNCSTGAAQVTVTSYTDAPTMVIQSGTLTCGSKTITLSGVSSPTTGISYTWTGPGIIGSNTTFSVDVNIGGNYDVTLLDAANGCTNTISTSVPSNTTIPTLTITPTSTVLSCSVLTSTLDAVPSVTDTPTWTTPSGNATNPVITGIAGTYTATVVDAINGCSMSETLTVIGSTVSPTADAGITTAIPCGTPSVALNGTSTSTDVVTYGWSGPNATSISGPSNVQNPIVVDQGVYTLTVTNTASGCIATATVNVTQGNVIASFTANPTSGLTPLDVNFTDGSTGAIGYNWNFGDSNSSSSQNPSHTFTTGTYTVILTVTSGPCIDTASVIIVVEDGLTLEIPNVFTPNGDGSNDIFTIKSTGVKEISLQIFNRWGQKLYEFIGPNASWDGLTNQGSKVPEGTYFYFVKATGFDNSEIQKNGTANLFR